MRTSKCKNKCYGRKHHTKVLPSVALLLVLITLQTSRAGVRPKVEMDKQLEQAILAEDWEKVIQLLPAEAEPNLPAALRLVKGHARLATNRNNESLCLFLNASAEPDLIQWRQWSEDLVEKHPTSLITYYFLGDSYARLKQWDHAINDFNIALELDPNHPLVLNARGVAYVHKGLLNKARKDFAKAMKYSDGRLADAHANLGALCIRRNDAKAGALQAFKDALGVSSDFALALHGKGCIELIMNNLEDARKDLKAAIENCLCGQELMVENHLRYAVKAGGGDPEKILAEARESGTMLHRTYSHGELSNSASRWFNTGKNLGRMNWLPFNKHLENFCANRGAERLLQMHKDYSIDGISAWGKSNPSLSGYAHGHIGRVDDWNIRVQPYQDLGKGLGTSGTVAGLAIAPKTLGAGLAVAGGSAALGLGAAKTQEWSRIWNDRCPKIMDGLKRSMGSNLNPLAPMRDAGGVDIDPNQINWDEGEWPFQEYFGLMYSSGAREGGALTGERRSENEKGK